MHLIKVGAYSQRWRESLSSKKCYYQSRWASYNKRQHQILNGLKPHSFTLHVECSLGCWGPLLSKVTKEPRLADSITIHISILPASQGNWMWWITHWLLPLADKASHTAKPNSKRKEKYSQSYFIMCPKRAASKFWTALMTQINPKNVLVTVVIKCCYLHPLIIYSKNESLLLFPHCS